MLSVKAPFKIVSDDILNFFFCFVVAFLSAKIRFDITRIIKPHLLKKYKRKKKKKKKKINKNESVVCCC